MDQIDDNDDGPYLVFDKGIFQGDQDWIVE